MVHTFYYLREKSFLERGQVVLLTRIYSMAQASSSQVDAQRPSPQTLQSLVVEKQREESQIRQLKREEGTTKF
jgi:hypothetical protein